MKRYVTTLSVNVTPFVGVWIETYYHEDTYNPVQVTPFVGVWIETEKKKKSVDDSRSHTLRGCVD